MNTTKQPRKSPNLGGRDIPNGELAEPPDRQVGVSLPLVIGPFAYWERLQASTGGTTPTLDSIVWWLRQDEANCVTVTKDLISLETKV